MNVPLLHYYGTKFSLKNYENDKTERRAFYSGIFNLTKPRQPRTLFTFVRYLLCCFWTEFNEIKHRIHIYWTGIKLNLTLTKFSPSSNYSRMWVIQGHSPTISDLVSYKRIQDFCYSHSGLITTSRGFRPFKERMCCSFYV